MHSRVKENIRQWNAGQASVSIHVLPFGCRPSPGSRRIDGCIQMQFSMNTVPNDIVSLLNRVSYGIQNCERQFTRSLSAAHTSSVVGFFDARIMQWDTGSKSVLFLSFLCRSQAEPVAVQNNNHVSAFN